MRIFAGTSLDNFMNQYDPDNNAFIQDSEDPLSVFTSLKDPDLFFMVKQAEAHSKNKGGEPIIIEGEADESEIYKGNNLFETCDRFGVKKVYDILEKNGQKELKEDPYILKGTRNYSEAEEK